MKRIRLKACLNGPLASARLGASLLLIALALPGCTNQKAPKTQKTSASKTTALFNGKDLTGWTQYLRKNAQSDDVFVVQEGIIKCSGKPIGYIRTNDDYENYVLTLEWRWPEKEGNSGVLLHMQGDDKVWPKSLEAQLKSKDAGDIWSNEGTTLNVPDAENRIKERRVINLNDDAEKPPGEWNKYEITCKAGTITLKINDKLVNAGTDASVTKGKIGLQSEGTPIDFRKITITKLD